MISHNSIASEEKLALEELQAHIGKSLQVYGEESEHYGESCTQKNQSVCEEESAFRREDIGYSMEWR